MNAKMVEAVRGRLEGMGDEELLRLWRENDRERYSEEAFEAARLILVARGVEVPAQEPAVGRVPVARKARSADTATGEFWMEWLRPVLWVGVVLGATGSLHVAVQAIIAARAEVWSEFWWGSSFSEFVEVVQMWMEFLLPLLLLAGAVGCLGRKRVFRRVMLVWAWAMLASLTISIVAYIVRFAVAEGEGVQRTGWLLSLLYRSLFSAVYPAAVLFVLTRSQIKRLFEAPVVGFDLAAPGEEAGGEADQQGEGDRAEGEKVG